MGADGDSGDAEREWLDHLAVHEQLGLAQHELHALLDTSCEALLPGGQLQKAGACAVHERTLADLVGQTQDPALQLTAKPALAPGPPAPDSAIDQPDLRFRREQVLDPEGARSGTRRARCRPFCASQAADSPSAAAGSDGRAAGAPHG